ncbi:MAG: hypothetical protein E5V52_15415, partial [Mesorhizobium sp.]
MTNAKPTSAVKTKPWTEVATHLVDVAMGRKPADLVIRNGRWVNVHSGEIIPGTDIAITARQNSVTVTMPLST